MDLTRQEIGAVVRQAAATIKERGWVQGNYGDRDHGYCAIGAVRAVIGTGVQYQQIAIELNIWMRSLIHSKGPIECAVTDFNDTPGRTREEILLHMNKFADEMDPQCQA